MKGFRKGTVLFFLAMLLITLAVAGGDPSVRSSVDKTHLRMGEDLIFTLRIEGAAGGMTQPILPPLPGFKVSGSYQSVERSGGKTALLFHYILNPTKTGHLVIPPMTLRIGGITRVVSGFSADVETVLSGSSGGGLFLAKPAPRSLPSLGNDVFLAGRLSTHTAFVGQPVTYTLNLLTKRSITGLDVVKAPGFDGFRMVNDPTAINTPPRQVRRGGRLFLEAVVRRATLFPLKPGRLTIGAFKAELRVQTSGFGGPARAIVVGGSAILDVRPLPKAPPAFAGAVGSFSLNVVQPPPSRIEVGKPFSMTIDIRGRGFLPEKPLRQTPSPFFTAYPPAVKDTSGFVGGVFSAHRTIRLSFLPKVAGTVEFPPLTLVYFNPGTKSYSTLKAGSGRFDISGNPKAHGVGVRLAAIIKMPKADPPPGWNPSPKLFWGLFAAPFLVSVLMAMALWLYRILLRDEEKRRRRALRYESRRNLFHARRHLDVRKAGIFHESLARALSAALDLKTGCATRGLNRSQLSALLERTGVVTGERNRLLKLTEELETARYAPEKLTKQEFNASFKEVARWVREAGRG